MTIRFLIRCFKSNCLENVGQRHTHVSVCLWETRRVGDTNIFQLLVSNLLLVRAKRLYCLMFSLSAENQWNKDVCLSNFIFCSVWLLHRYFFYILFPLKDTKALIFLSFSVVYSQLYSVTLPWPLFSFSPSSPKRLRPNDLLLTHLPLLCLSQAWLTLWSNCWPSTTICLKFPSPTPWAGMVS